MFAALYRLFAVDENVLDPRCSLYPTHAALREVPGLFLRQCIESLEVKHSYIGSESFPQQSPVWEPDVPGNVRRDAPDPFLDAHHSEIQDPVPQKKDAFASLAFGAKVGS